MHYPKEYQKANSMQSTDVVATLKEFPVEWKDTNARIIDIGCGDGGVTMGIWKKHIPGNFMKIVGSDKSQTCVDFAKKHYEGEQVEFMRLDIEEELPNELRGRFDHVISSYTFHWVHKQKCLRSIRLKATLLGACLMERGSLFQRRIACTANEFDMKPVRKAFSNIYGLLEKGGNCLIIFLGYVDIYDYYRKLSHTPKWGADLENCETKFVSPYHDSKDPGDEITSLMKKIGFKDIDVKVQNKTFDFVGGVVEFRRLMKCMNPFDALKDKWDDFMDDYDKLNPNAGSCVYQLLVVSGKK